MAAQAASWLETKAKVTDCKYLFARMNTFTFGISTDDGPFKITFTYSVHGKSYTDEFTSPTYLEQGRSFPISYNPFAPHQNSKSASTPASRTPLFTVGVAGSVIFSLLYLAWLHGCN